MIIQCCPHTCCASLPQHPSILPDSTTSNPLNSGVFRSRKRGTLILTFDPRRCRILAVKVPNLGCGLMILSEMYSLSVTGPPTGAGGTEPSSPSAPRRGNDATVGAISFSLRTVRIRFRRSLMFRSTRSKSVENPVYGRFGVASRHHIRAPSYILLSIASSPILSDSTRP